MLKILLVGLLLSISQPVLAQEGGGWSEPVIVSDPVGGWFPAIAVDGVDRVHVVWTGGIRDRSNLGYDSLFYVVGDGLSWSRPNDVISIPQIGGVYTLRPALAVDRNDDLNLSLRYPVAFHFARAPADAAWSAQAWTSPRRLSKKESGWADMALDSQGVVHVIWSESVDYELAGGASVLLPGNALFEKADDEWAAYSPSEGLAGEDVLDIATDASGRKWFATDGGLSVLSADGSRWMTYTVTDGLVAEQIHKVLIDGAGNKWLATPRGVSVLNDAATPFDKSDDLWIAYTAADGLAGDNVEDLAIGLDDQIWFATDKGVSVLSITDKKWMTFTSADGLTSDFVQAVLIDRTGYKWFGTQHGVSVLNDGDTPFDKSDDVWTAYTQESGLASRNVLAIAGDDRGSKWFGTTGGLSLLDDGGTPFDDSDDEWTVYTTRHGLPDGRVTALTVDAKGNVWVGTAAGISVFSPDNARSVSYTVNDGLVEAFISAIAVDPSGGVWLGTTRGVWGFSISRDVFYRHSADGGQTWSVPKNLSRSRSPVGTSLHLHIDTQDVIHVVWDEAASAAYVSSTDGGENWSQRHTFYSNAGNPRQIVAGVDGEGKILVVWRTASELTRQNVQLFIYYQLSSDGGFSWSEPAPIPNLLTRALNDTPFDAYDLAADSAGHLHLIVVGMPGVAETNLSVLHTEWDGKRWSPPYKVFSTPGFPERPVITINRGNQLHTAWFVRGAGQQEAEERDYQVWYARGQSAAPVVPPPPSPSPLATPAPAHTPTLLPSPTPYPTWAPGLSAPRTDDLYTESDEVFRTAVAVFPVILLSLLIAIARLRWSGK